MLTAGDDNTASGLSRQVLQGARATTWLTVGHSDGGGEAADSRRADLHVRAAPTASCAALGARVARPAPAEFHFFPSRPGTPVCVLPVTTLALFGVSAFG
jgi:hypothetical protein